MQLSCFGSNEYYVLYVGIGKWQGPVVTTTIDSFHTNENNSGFIPQSPHALIVGTGGGTSPIDPVLSLNPGLNQVISGFFAGYFPLFGYIDGFGIFQGCRVKIEQASVATDHVIVENRSDK